MTRNKCAFDGCNQHCRWSYSTFSLLSLVAFVECMTGYGEVLGALYFYDFEEVGVLLLPGRTRGHVGTINQLMRTGVTGDTGAERCKVFSSLLD